jgi:hypothetical protein
MRRVVFVLAIGSLVVVCFGGMWLASRPPIRSLLPPDATDIHMVDADCYRYLFQRSNSSLKCIFWPVGAVIMTHFRRYSRRFSPFSSHPEKYR